MKIFDKEYVELLCSDAALNPRKRQHRNIHHSYQDPCQRLFNAIDPSSYIRPHRHLSCARDELLVVVRGLIALVEFDADGKVNTVTLMGSEKHGASFAVGVEVTPDSWHTVVALEPGSILLEVKAGPFDPTESKEFAPWAPEEGSEMAERYLEELLTLISLVK